MKIFLTIAVLIIGMFVYVFGAGKLNQNSSILIDRDVEKVGKQYKMAGLFIVLVGIILLWTQSIVAGSIVTLLVLLAVGLENVNPYYLRSKRFFEIYKGIKEIYKGTKVHDIHNIEYMVQYASVEQYLMRNKKILWSHQRIIDGIFEDKSAKDLKKLAYSLLASEDIYTNNYHSDISGDLALAHRESYKKDAGIDKAYSKTFGNIRPLQTQTSFQKKA